MNYVIRTVNVTKSFKERNAVEDVSMNIKKGEIYALLGENGAGKTTLMKMITNLIRPSIGEIEIFGEKLSVKSFEILKRMGQIIEYPVFYNKLTAKENIELHLEYMGYYDERTIDEIFKLVHLEENKDKKVREFSLGMKQRLGIARAISTRPEILILDEPINGLDPVGVKEIRELLKKLSKEYGMTILISSHILGEIERLADKVGIMEKGRLHKEVTIESIREKNLEYIELVTKDIRKAAYILTNDLKISNFKILDNDSIKIYDLNIPQNVISKTLILNDINIESIIRKKSNLEDYFLKTLRKEDYNV